MRILFLTHYFPPEVNAPAVRTYEHTRRWVRQGHEVHVVTCVPNHPRGEPFPGYVNLPGCQHERVEGIHLHRVWTYLAANRGVVRRILNYLSYMVSASLACLRLPRPDVVVATSPQFFCAWAGFIASRLLRRPWVFELRDIWPGSIVAVGAMRNRAAIKALEALELYLYRQADSIVALTEPFRKDLVERGVPAEKIRVVTNGVDPGSWSSLDRRAARAELGLDSQFVVSYVGTHGMAHHLETVLEAAELLRDERDIQFALVGDGAEREKLLKLKQSEGLHNVWMVGQVPRSQAKAYLAASNVSLVVLRRAELFKTVIPSKLFEAMAARVPIVLGVEGEAARLLRKAGAGLCVEPENARALADAIVRLKCNEDLREELGSNGYRAVRDEFSREELAGRMLELIQNCAAR